MKNIIFLRLLILALFYLFFSTESIFAQSGESSFPDPEIRIGKAKVTGRIINYHPIVKGSKITVSIRFENMVTEEEMKFESYVNASNQFSFEIPIERNVAFVNLNLASEKYDFGWYIIGLNQDKPLIIEVNLIDSTSFKIIRSTGGVGIDNNEMEDVMLAYTNFIEFNTWGDYYKMNPEEFLNETLQKELKNRIQTAMDSLSFSNRVSKFITNDFTFLYIKGRVLHYKTVVEQSAEMEEYSPNYSPFSAIEPDEPYYNFFKSFNLNNPQYLYCIYFSELIRKFLSVPAFKIRKINDENIEEWLDRVKSITKEILGFDKGLFYDLLAAKAYAIQLSDWCMPFSETQKKNIQNYFSKNNAELLKVLMKANENLIQNLSKDLQIREIPNAPNEALMDSIIERYKGHVILIDLWATWCNPCMRAHTEMQQIKNILKEKGVKLVYFADENSPEILWKKKINIIGGEHYYFSKNQWEYLLNSLSFKSIPIYLIYDKKGALVHKFTGFPGVTKMKEMLLEQLNN